MGNRFGVWTAVGAAAAGTGYAVAQVLQILGALTDPWDRILIFATSLALAPAFVLAVAATHVSAPPQRRMWSLGALALAILYAADVSLVYVVQLGAVIPHDLHGEGSAVALAACCSEHMPATAIDLLGYTYMSFSMLLLAPVFAGNPTTRWLRWVLVANGFLGAIIFAELVWPWLIYAASPWLVTFPAAMVLLARQFAAAPPSPAL
jgi:hypothetical protein